MFDLNFINIRLLKAEVAIGQRDADGIFELRIPASERTSVQCFARNFPIRWSFVVLRYLRFAHSAPFADFSWLPSSTRTVCQTPSAKCTLPSIERNVTLCFLLTSRAINFHSREWKGWFAAVVHSARIIENPNVKHCDCNWHAQLENLCEI